MALDVFTGNEFQEIYKLWGYLVERGIATNEELQLITDINGYSEDTLDDVLYARTGYRNIKQLMEEEFDDYEDL